MSRVAITEYAAKKLFLGENYMGQTVTSDSFESVLKKLPRDSFFVVKIDCGIKKRGLQNLVDINLNKTQAKETLKRFFSLGYNRCLIEPYIEHSMSKERYISLTLEREGLSVITSDAAGVEIEGADNKVEKRTLTYSDVLDPDKCTLKGMSVNLGSVLRTMQQYSFSFLEANPYIETNNSLFPLDLAVEIDTAALKDLPEWVREHIITNTNVSTQETAIRDLNDSSQASFNLHILNPDGAVLTLLSGGGASLITLDTLVASSLQDEVINYSEYSGAPTREETERFTDTLLTLLFKSSASKKVALIAGGVSNFTDVLKTFQGIADAVEKNIDAIVKDNICFVVRRGGLNQTEGLAYLEDFFIRNKIRHEVSGPELSLGKIGSVVKKYL